MSNSLDINLNKKGRKIAKLFKYLVLMFAFFVYFQQIVT